MRGRHATHWWRSGRRPSRRTGTPIHSPKTEHYAAGASQVLGFLEAAHPVHRLTRSLTRSIRGLETVVARCDNLPALTRAAILAMVQEPDP